jgi:hypothetical protein
MAAEKQLEQDIEAIDQLPAHVFHARIRAELRPDTRKLDAIK